MSLLKKYAQAGVESHSEAGAETGLIEQIEHAIPVEVPEVQEVTPEQAYEAEQVLNAVTEAPAPVYDPSEDAETLIEGMETYIEVLQFGLDNKQFDKQTIGVAIADLNAIRSGVGIEEFGLEGYGEEDLESLYKVAIEGFTDAVAKVVLFPVKLLNGLGFVADDFLSKAIGVALGKSLNARADSLLNDLAGIDNRKVEMDLGKYAGALAVGGKISTPLKTNLATATASHKELLMKYPENALAYIDSIKRLMEECKKDIKNDKPFADKIKTFAKKPTADQQLSKNITEGRGLLDNHRVIIHGKSAENDKRDDDIANKFKISWLALASHEIRIDRAFETKTGPDTYDITAVELREMAKLVKEVAAAMIQGFEKNRGKLGQIVNKAQMDGMAESLRFELKSNKESMKAFRALAVHYLRAGRTVYYSMEYLQHNALSEMRGVANFIEAATKVIKKDIKKNG